MVTTRAAAVTDDVEELLWRVQVYAKYPAAYQDYLGNIWTDDHYDCDSHCLSHIDNVAGMPPLPYRPRFKANWRVAAERCRPVGL
jgi:hypothetical protein